MKQVIFISKTAKNYFKNNLSYKNLIYDYFDIEVQKILPILGYRYKCSPELIISYKKMKNKKIIKCFDIDNYVFVPFPEERDFTQRFFIKYDCG